MISENEAEWEYSVNMLIITPTEDLLTVMILGALLLIINFPYLMELSEYFCIQYNVMTCIKPHYDECPVFVDICGAFTEVVLRLSRADHCISFLHELTKTQETCTI